MADNFTDGHQFMRRYLGTRRQFAAAILAAANAGTLTRDNLLQFREQLQSMTDDIGNCRDNLVFQAAIITDKANPTFDVQAWMDGINATVTGLLANIDALPVRSTYTRRQVTALRSGAQAARTSLVY